MKIRHSLLGLTALSTLAFTGCFGESSSKTVPNPDQRRMSGGADRDPRGLSGETWPDYPNVPYVEIMEEVDGLPIPRMEVDRSEISFGEAIPADVGNEFAKAHPGEPATGGRLRVRLSAEPKTLNPITESSAYQTYIMQHSLEALAEMDPETLEYHPKIAKTWITEDSVKLAADYAGSERRVVFDDGEPETEITVTYPKTKDEDDPPTLTFTVQDAEGNISAGTWLGLFPEDTDPGAPINGYHHWSNEQGEVAVNGIVPGEYTVKVGHEIFGDVEEGDDGTLTITPKSPKNPLTDLLPDGEETLALTSEEYSDIQRDTIYTYPLKEEVRWSDGEPFTAADLEFGYAVINNPAVDGDSIRVYYSDVTDVQALDPHTVRMKYRQQYFKAFEFTMGLAAYSPPLHLFKQLFKEKGLELTLERLTPQEEKQQNKVSAHGTQFAKFFNTNDSYNRSPIGTGPYTVGDWEHSMSVTLTRNPNYWDDEGAGYLDEIVYRFIPDDVTAMQALKAGEIDFFYRMSPEQYHEDLGGPPPWFKRSYVKAAWFSPGFSYVGWNMLRPKFQDRRVRLALALLFDVKEYVDQKLHGEAVPVSGSQYIFGPGYDHDVKPIGHDPETAAELLADAGWVDTDGDGVLDKGGEKLAFEFLMPQGATMVEEQAALIQKAYKEAGIQMDIAILEWATFLERIMAKDFDVCRLSWASPIESDPFQIWHGSQAGAENRSSNHVSFSDPTADELIERVRLTLDLEERKRVFWSLHRILDREQPYLFLYTPKDYGGYHQRFQGVKWYRVRPGFDFTEWYVPKDQQMF